MRIDKELLDKLTEQAKESPRLRMNYDLRNTPEDGSQRMLNALEPGTVLPIHRHRTTSEAVSVLRGSCVQYVYDERGVRTDAVEMAAGSDCAAMVVEAGVWHRLESLESGTVIMESKDGRYEPLAEGDIMQNASGDAEENTIQTR